MTFEPEVITLTSEERIELAQRTQSRTLPAGDVFRARLILMLADQFSYRTIEERLDTTVPTISRWKNRFLQDRIAGLLETRHPGQNPFVITPTLQAKILEATRRKPDLTGCFCTTGSERESHQGGEPVMSIRKYKPEQIVTVLRQIEVAMANGKTAPQACQ